MTVQSTAAAVDAVEEAREQLAPAVEKLAEAAAQTAAQVREEMGPGLAERASAALSDAAERVSANGTQQPRSSPWRPVLVAGIIIVGGIVMVRVVRTRRATQAWADAEPESVDVTDSARAAADDLA